MHPVHVFAYLFTVTAVNVGLLWQLWGYGWLRHGLLDRTITKQYTLAIELNVWKAAERRTANASVPHDPRSWDASTLLLRLLGSFVFSFGPTRMGQ